MDASHRPVTIWVDCCNDQIRNKITIWTTDTLIEFSEPSSIHRRVVSPVYFGDMITFYARYFIHCQVSSERNLQINQLDQGKSVRVWAFAVLVAAICQRTTQQKGETAVK